MLFWFKSRFNNLTFYPTSMPLLFLFRTKTPNVISFVQFFSWPLPIATCNQSHYTMTNVHIPLNNQKSPTPPLGNEGIVVFCLFICLFLFLEMGFLCGTAIATLELALCTRNTCIHTNIHTYIQMCVCVCVCVCARARVRTCAVETHSVSSANSL